MSLIPNARKWYRMFSIQANALNGAFLGTWVLLPPKFQEAVPVPVVIGIAIGFLVLGVIGRLWSQPTVHE